MSLIAKKEKVREWLINKLGGHIYDYRSPFYDKSLTIYAEMPITVKSELFTSAMKSVAPSEADIRRALLQKIEDELINNHLVDFQSQPMNQRICHSATIRVIPVVTHT